MVFKKVVLPKGLLFFGFLSKSKFGLSMLLFGLILFYPVFFGVVVSSCQIGGQADAVGL